MGISTTGVGREVRLIRRPAGLPEQGDFELAEVELREPGPGELLVRNLWFSVDPYMRLRMEEEHPYGSPYTLGEALDGDALGIVEATGDDQWAVGDPVLHPLGWRDRALVPARQAKPVDRSDRPQQAYLGVLGWPGYAAYMGLLDVAGLREEDVVYVSGAAGAVGSMVGQIAKLRGNTVIGCAGSDDKVAYLRDELNFDAAFNYRSGSIVDQLREAAPQGIDVYFDNVGSDQLEAAIETMNVGGRIAMCGAIAGYSAVEPPCAPRNLFTIVVKQLRLQGFLVDEDADRWRRFNRDVGRWYDEGLIVQRETVMKGIDNAVTAFLGMLQGQNVGKMLVEL